MSGQARDYSIFGQIRDSTISLAKRWFLQSDRTLYSISSETLDPIVSVGQVRHPPVSWADQTSDYFWTDKRFCRTSRQTRYISRYVQTYKGFYSILNQTVDTRASSYRPKESLVKLQNSARLRTDEAPQYLVRLSDFTVFVDRPQTLQYLCTDLRLYSISGQTLDSKVGRTDLRLYSICGQTSDSTVSLDRPQTQKYTYTDVRLKSISAQTSDSTVSLDRLQIIQYLWTDLRL